uniref:Uncharacterized protein n=1 Tax=Glossina brevipalpis TaxID=37001 RepID=A0A1A9WED2_9MUSC
MFRITLILITIVTPAFFSENRYLEFDADFEYCRRERRLNLYYLNRLKMGMLTSPTYEEKCFLDCLYEKSGILRNGFLQKTALKRNIGYIADHELLEDILPPCYVIRNGTNKCDTAFELKKCFKYIGFEKVWLKIPWEPNADPRYIATMNLINELENFKYRVAFS